MKGKISNAY